MKEKKSLSSLQAGRGIAAVAVVAYHLSITLGQPRYLGEAVFEGLTWRGNLGVDFFFVLSGFIILFAHNQDIGRPERLSDYLLKRFIRLFPIYWIYVGGFCLLLALGLGTAASMPQTMTDWVTTLLLIRFDNFLLPISPAWTLIHELAFYAVFATLIINLRLGVFCFAVWLVAIMAIFTYAPSDDRWPLTTYFSAYNLDFLLGMAAYLVWKRSSLQTGNGLLVTGLVLLAAALTGEVRGFSPHWLPLAYGVAFACILAGASARESHGAMASSTLLGILGNASYSIYLLHNALIGLFTKILMKVGGFLPLMPEVIFFGVLLLAVAGGCAAYWLVERPLLNLLRRLLLPRRRIYEPIPQTAQ